MNARKASGALASTGVGLIFAAMTATTTHLDMGKRMALSVLIASIAPSILAQNNCDE